MPVGQVEHIFLGVSEPIKLGLAPLWADLAGVEVLASKETINMLKAPAFEGDPYAHTEKLIWTRVYEGILGRGA